MQQRLKIFTWHIHGSYLYYLSQGNYDIYIPVDETGSEGYTGRGAFPFGNNVHEVPAHAVKELELDCILFQSQQNYLADQYDVLSPTQRQLPRVYLEHDPPRSSPTETCHLADDPDITLVHVTHFNKLMQRPGIDLVAEAGNTGPGELALLIQHAGLLLSNDTGVSHIAAAFETRSVIVFSPYSDPACWAPLNKSLHTAVTAARAVDPQHVLQCALQQLRHSHYQPAGQIL